MSNFPQMRLRRLRRTKAIRDMVGLAMPGPEKFVWPVFVVDGQNKNIPIATMPGQSRLSIDCLSTALEPVVKSGVGGVLVFGVLDDGKMASGDYAFDDNGLVQTAVRRIRERYPELLIMTDVCLCAYTDHGHCGKLDASGDVDNDATLDILGKVAVSHAKAGADCVAPSAMMDGQVENIRDALAAAGMQDVILMSYSTKFCSAFYGPFRDAASSSPAAGGRQTYQAPFNDPRQALRESFLDIDEGADILMVKPSLIYLDIICQLRSETDLPIAAYNVSGEYAMLHAYAEKGGGELRDLVRESVMALTRAGADIIITYWANQYNEIFRAE